MPVVLEESHTFILIFKHNIIICISEVQLPTRNIKKEHWKLDKTVTIES